MNHRNTIDWRLPKEAAWHGNEHDLQTEIVTRCLGFAHKHPDIMLLHAIPNGGWRGQHAGKLLKAEGVISGFLTCAFPLLSLDSTGFTWS